MHEFSDKHGNKWPIELSLGMIRKIKRLSGVDLLDIYSGKPLEQLSNDELLVDIIYLTVQDLAEERAISDEEFGCSLLGEHILAASEALIEEICFFFRQRNPDQAVVLDKVLEKVKQADKTAVDWAMRKLAGDTIDKAIAQRMKAADEEVEKLTESISIAQPSNTPLA